MSNYIRLDVLRGLHEDEFMELYEYFSPKKDNLMVRCRMIIYLFEHFRVNYTSETLAQELREILIVAERYVAKTGILNKHPELSVNAVVESFEGVVVRYLYTKYVDHKDYLEEVRERKAAEKELVKDYEMVWGGSIVQVNHT